MNFKSFNILAPFSMFGNTKFIIKSANNVTKIAFTEYINNQASDDLDAETIDKIYYKNNVEKIIGTIVSDYALNIIQRESRSVEDAIIYFKSDPFVEMLKSIAKHNISIIYVNTDLKSYWETR